MGKDFFIQIGRKDEQGKAAAVSYSIPISIWDRWYKVEFQFKASPNGDCKMTHVTVTKNNYITVKERWYHRLYERIYLKFKTPKIGFAKDDSERH